METMSEEGFEEWDADFLDQLIHVEELALTSTKQQQPLRTTSSSSSSQTHHYINNPTNTNTNTMMSYSPPRQLSQRVSFDDKQLEIDMLKRELGHVSKQLTDLEQECLELRKERGKKEEQLQIFSKNEVKDVDARSTKSTTLEYGALNHHRVRQKFQNGISLNNQAGSQIDRAMPAYKAIGIQTEKAGDPGQVTMDVDPAACQALTEKLLAIWGSPRDQKLGRNLINKLLVTCQTDFHVLFAWMSVSVPKRTMDSLKDGSLSDVALTSHLHSFHTPEAAKVSHLYSVLTKISIGMVQLEALFEPLLDLCILKNVVIVHRSLCILRVFLKHLLSLERKSERRSRREDVCRYDLQWKESYFKSEESYQKQWKEKIDLETNLSILKNEKDILQKQCIKDMDMLTINTETQKKLASEALEVAKRRIQDLESRC